VAMVVVIPLAETPKTICFISALVFWIVKMAITRDFRIKMPRLAGSCPGGRDFSQYVQFRMWTQR
jgi:hypothetical protein